MSWTKYIVSSNPGGFHKKCVIFLCI